MALRSRPTVFQKKIATTGTAVKLGTADLFNGVIIKASPKNTQPIFVGGATVNTTDDGTGNGYRIDPGEAMSFGVSEVDDLYINGTANDFVYVGGN